jgi:hypothetical protein
MSWPWRLVVGDGEAVAGGAVAVASKKMNKVEREETGGERADPSSTLGSCQRHVSGCDECGSVVDDTLLFF